MNNAAVSRPLAIVEVSEVDVSPKTQALLDPPGGSIMFMFMRATILLLLFSPPLLAADAKKDPKAKPNRLARESSPYLLQHAYNPVDWFPWGPEAFEKAKKEGKMIFL